MSRSNDTKTQDSENYWEVPMKLAHEFVWTKDEYQRSWMERK